MGSVWNSDPEPVRRRTESKAEPEFPNRCFPILCTEKHVRLMCLLHLWFKKFVPFLIPACHCHASACEGSQENQLKPCLWVFNQFLYPQASWSVSEFCCLCCMVRRPSILCFRSSQPHSATVISSRIRENRGFSPINMGWSLIRNAQIITNTTKAEGLPLIYLFPWDIGYVVEERHGGRTCLPHITWDLKGCRSVGFTQSMSLPGLISLVIRAIRPGAAGAMYFNHVSFSSASWDSHLTFPPLPVFFFK